MKRRTFLKISSGTLAAAGLTNILRAQSTEETPYLYKYSDTKTKTEFSVSFFMSAFNKFKTADPKKKTVTLEVTRTDTGGVKTIGRYETELTSMEAVETVKDRYIAKGSPLKLVSGKAALPADFPARVSIAAFLSNTPTANYFSFLREDGSTYLECYAPGSSNYDYDLYEGCFLTTACTENKGLPDNCYELETLRGFRDNYMRKLPEGDQLIKSYYQMGPAVVNNINSRPNRSDIYDHIYATLITPALELIETGNYPEAMTYYKDYIIALHHQLNLPKPPRP